MPENVDKREGGILDGTRDLKNECRVLNGGKRTTWKRGKEK
jgi:hypothetical protein